MNPKPPSRGPRAMHGLGRLFLQAQALPLETRGTPRPGPMPGLAGLSAEADKELRALHQLLVLRTLQVSRVRQVLEVFRAQTVALSPEHPARVLVEQVLNTVGLALDVPGAD